MSSGVLLNSRQIADACFEASLSLQVKKPQRPTDDMPTGDPLIELPNPMFQGC